MQKIENFDKSKMYLVYCRSGSRSVAACQILESVGIKNVYNLTGGITDWNGDIIV
jgi:rhodanese-related sulfurtransferase